MEITEYRGNKEGLPSETQAQEQEGWILLQDRAYDVGDARTVCCLYMQGSEQTASSSPTAYDRFRVTVYEVDRGYLHIGPCDAPRAVEVFSMLTRYEVAFCHVVDILEELDIFVPVRYEREVTSVEEAAASKS